MLETNEHWVACLPAIALAVCLALILAGCGDADAPGAAADRADVPPPEPSPQDGKGTAVVEPAADVRVGERGTWRITYTAGPEGIAAGGGIVLQVSPFWGWSPPQSEEPRAPGFVTVTSSATEPEIALNDDPSRHWIQALFEGAPLPPGATVSFVYGDTSDGMHPDGSARADQYAEDEEEFLLKVDGDGDGFYVPIETSPSLNVLAGPMARLFVSAPSFARPGETVELRIAALDARMNRATGFAGTVRLRSLEPGLEHPGEVAFRPEDRGVAVVAARAAAEGLARVVASLPDDPECIAVSNPVLVTDREIPYRLFWGDLQIHSGWSDGTGTPEQIFEYARDVAGLDVAVLTDHDAHGVFALDENPDEWARILRAVDTFHAPGRFVTYPGFEWTSWTFGHKHVIFLDGDAPLLSNRDPSMSTPDGLWSRLPEGRAMTISHHTLGRPVVTDWRYHDPRFEFLVEICSIHGSSEGLGEPMAVRGARAGHGVRDALARGYRLGFVGSGDTHNGHPGLGDPQTPLGGVAGIYARDRTRESIWEALRARRVYASSGPRVILDFTLNGEPMGSTVRLPLAATPRTLHVEAYSPLRIETLEIVKNGAVIVREPLDRLAFGIDLEDPEEARHGDTYYVRLRLLHDQLAWSSPIWIEMEASR